MRLHDITSARLVRDASIEAMDALNAIIAEAAPHVSTAEEMDLRLLDVDEDTWGAIATARARERQERA